MRRNQLVISSSLMLLGLELSVLSMFEGKYSNGKEFLLLLHPAAYICS